MRADGPKHGEPKSTAPTRPECSTRASVCHAIVWWWGLPLPCCTTSCCYPSSWSTSSTNPGSWTWKWSHWPSVSAPIQYSTVFYCPGCVVDISYLAAGIQDTSGTAAYTSSMRRADLALDDNASTPYLPYLPPTCMHVHMLLPTSRVQGPVWCPRIYAASVSDAMWLTQVCVCVFVRVCDEGAEMRCCQVGHPIRAVEWRVERSMSLLPISASTSLPVTQLILLASSFSLTALHTLLSHGMLPLAAVSASRSPTTNNSPKVSHWSAHRPHSARLQPLHISIRIQYQNFQQLQICILQHLRIRSNTVPLAGDFPNRPPSLIITVHLRLRHAAYDPARHRHDLAEELSGRVAGIVQSDISGVAAGSSEELSDGCRHDFPWVVSVLISMMLSPRWCPFLLLFACNWAGADLLLVGMEDRDFFPMKKIKSPSTRPPP